MTSTAITIPVGRRPRRLCVVLCATALFLLATGICSLQAADLPTLPAMEGLHPSLDEMPAEKGDIYRWSGSINGKQSREFVVKAYNNMVLRRTTSSWKREPRPQYTTAMESASVGIEIQAAEDLTQVVANFRKNFEENPHYEKFRKEPYGDEGYRYRRTTTQGYAGPSTTVLFRKGNIFVQVTAYSDHRFMHDKLAQTFASLVLKKVEAYGKQ